MEEIEQVNNFIMFVDGHYLLESTETTINCLFINDTHISKRTDLSGSFPTKLVDDSWFFCELVYANRLFYEFYAYMEKLCSLFSCTHNLVLYGNSIMRETKDSMYNSNQLKFIFTSIVLDTVDYLSDESDYMLVYSYFNNLLIWM